MTYQNNIDDRNSNSWLSSGKKFNDLLKATTVGMANKAKKVAKEFNDTMQANFEYYLPEKVSFGLMLFFNKCNCEFIRKHSSQLFLVKNSHEMTSKRICGFCVSATARYFLALFD